MGIVRTCRLSREWLCFLRLGFLLLICGVWDARLVCFPGVAAMCGGDDCSVLALARSSRG